jgi:hypothetical protein
MSITQPIAEKPIVHTNVSPALHENSTAVWGEPTRDAKNNVVPAPLVAPDGKDLPSLTAGKTALRTLYNGLAQCEEAVSTAKKQYGISPNAGSKVGQPMPPVLSEEKSNELAGSLGVAFGRIAKIVDQQIGVLAETIVTLDQKIAASLRSPHKDILSATEASDVRGHVKSMPPGERMNWLHARIEEGDHSVVSAVLASHWAAGIDKANYETLTDMASRKFAPTARAQADAVRALHAHVTQGAQNFTNRFRQIAPVPTADSPAVAAAKKLREA